MSSFLPDIARTGQPDALSPLDWVGMQGLDLPVRMTENGQILPAKVDVAVNLPSREVKGIHMSRLHRLLNEFSEQDLLRPDAVRSLLDRLIASHEDCRSTAARVAWHFDILRKRPALLTENLAGWQAYPVEIEASQTADATSLRLATSVLYSSTCPCSAALARQVVSDAFVRDAAGAATMPVAQAADWILQNASVATAHAQRSVARVSVALTRNAGFDIEGLIQRVENALGTAVQTAVKRADEQEFARLNGRNLMYVEDAARRIQEAFNGAADYREVSIQVRHLESLHPHDAVASSALLAA